MDLLSDVVAAMRIGRPHSTRVERTGPWTLRSDRFPGAGFHVVLEGTCRLAPERGRPIALGAGDVAFLPNGQAHTLEGGAAPSTVMLCGAYTLDQHRLHPLLRELPPVVHLPARLGRHGSLRGAVDLLAAELATPRPGAGAIVPGLLDVLLLYILRTWLEERAHHGVATGWAAALHDRSVDTALSRMHEEPARPWTVRALGAAAGMSRAPFARRFTELVGTPPLRYLTWWRMVVGARLLRDTDAPLAAIAERCGYRSEYAFAKAFKRAHGVAPGAYRRSRG